MDEVQRLLTEVILAAFFLLQVDDGYRDNRDFALAVTREFDAPWYVASDFAHGTGRL